MSQDFTDDCYASGHQVTTDLENIEKNFAALKSCFSGATAPSNLVAGMWWLDTTAHLLKIRNEANDAWLSVWDMANNKPVIANLSDEITVAMIASSAKDAAASTASLRTLGTGAQQAMPGNTSIIPPNGSIAQAKLKTSSGEVYIGGTQYYQGTETKTLPGGEYGFYPQTKIYYTGSSGRVCTFEANIYKKTSDVVSESYNTNITLSIINGVGGDYPHLYATQRYVTSSGEVNWLFFLRYKATGKVHSGWMASDHPCFGNGGDPTIVQHPFVDYDSTVDEIVCVILSNEELDEIKNNTDKGSSPLQTISDKYEIDDDEKTKTPDWPTKEVTVGLPEGYDWQMAKAGDKVTPIKKVIPQPDNVLVRTLRLK